METNVFLGTAFEMKPRAQGKETGNTAMRDHASAIWTEEPRQDPEECGLAGTIMAIESQPFTAAEFERNIFQNIHAPLFASQRSFQQMVLEQCRRDHRPFEGLPDSLTT